MVMPNTDRISKALDLLRDGLRPKCEETWSGFFGDDWLNIVNGRLHNPEPSPKTSDVAFLFKGMKATWNDVFGHGFPPAIRRPPGTGGEPSTSWSAPSTPRR